MVQVYIFLFILGGAVGSFLNVVSDRLPNDQSLNGRSHCEFCKKTLAWYDLIPVVSFLLIRAKCRYCHKKLSWWYWIAEVGTGLAFVATYYLTSCSRFCPASPFPPQGEFIGVITLTYYLILVSTLLAILFSDIKSHIIPDQLTILFTIVTIPFVILHPVDSFLGSIVLVGIIGGIWLVTKGKGMGFGDVKFAVPMGLLLGLWVGVMALYLAFMLGGLVGIIAVVGKMKKMKSQIAFGPFLILGILIMIFFHEYITSVISRFSIFS